MIKNYIILAWRVLGRKKFFTFISLFGISFTLGILMVILSFLETELGSDAPWGNRDRMVKLARVELKNMVQDTTMLVDSLMVSGSMQYDTTYSYGENSNSTTIGSLSGKFLLDHFSDLENSEAHTFFLSGVTYNTYVQGSKVVLDVTYSDHNIWKIYNFEFLEGQGYDEGMFNRAEPVVVITDEIADKVFGTTTNVLGKELKMDGRLHKVIGLVEKPKSAQLSVGVYAPSTLTKNYPGRLDRYTGGYHAIFLAPSPGKTDALIKEIENLENVISTDPVPDYNKLILNEYPGTMFGFFAQGLIPSNIPSEAALVLRIILLGFISLFVLLPTLNLINLNVSRIMERSSEIGVRKSFGASKANILGQFIFENVILTIIGGIIGFVIALILINFINGANLLDGMMLTINLRFFLFSFLIVIIFGIISGFLPAYRMSKIHIVQALKSNKI